MSENWEFVDMATMRPEELSGKCILIEDRVYMLMSFVGQGAEAIVYLAINTVSIVSDHVIKIWRDQSSEFIDWKIAKQTHGLHMERSFEQPPIRTLPHGFFVTPQGAVGVQRYLGSAHHSSADAETKMHKWAKDRLDAGEAETAMDLCREALEINGNFTPALELLADLVLARGEHEAALELLERANLIDPVNLERRELAVRTLATLGYSLRAVEDFRWIQGHFPDAHKLNELCVELYCEIEHPAAARYFLEHYKNFFTVKRGHSRLSSLIGSAGTHGEEMEARIEPLTVATRGGDFEAVINLAFAYRDTGRLSQAADLLARIAERIRDSIGARLRAGGGGEYQPIPLAEKDCLITIMISEAFVALMRGRLAEAAHRFEAGAGMAFKYTPFRGADLPGVVTRWELGGTVTTESLSGLQLLRRLTRSDVELGEHSLALFQAYRDTYTLDL